MFCQKTTRIVFDMKTKSLGIIFLLAFFAFGCAQKEEPRKPISRVSGSFLKKSIEISKEVVSDEEQVFDSIIKANADTAYFLSQKGYWYTFLETSTTEDYLPKSGDIVYFDSEIFSVSGDTIYKSGEIPTKEYMVDKEDIIIGIRDGVKRMKKGEKVQFLFPSHVAYGYLGDKKRIGMNIPIIYTLTILDIKKNNNDLKTD